MELEIKLMWCKGLTTFNFFQKLSVYVAVSLNPDDKNLKITQSQKQEQKTPIDQQGDGNPEWNSVMKFDLSSLIISSNLHKLALVFEIRNQGQIFGYKEIGEVRVPVKDLVESVGVGAGRLVSYEVRGPDGKHNGVLDFSYKVLNKAGLGNSGIQISRFENHNSYFSDSDKIQYPKLEFDTSLNSDFNSNLNGNPSPTIPSIWPPGNQPQFWAPPPPPAYYGAPPPPLPACCGEQAPPAPLPAYFGGPPPSLPACCREQPPCCGEQPPPPPPLVLPGYYHQQAYGYQPPVYGDPYRGTYHEPPPGYHQQQSPGGGGCEYPHW